MCFCSRCFDLLLVCSVLFVGAFVFVVTIFCARGARAVRTFWFLTGTGSRTPLVLFRVAPCPGGLGCDAVGCPIGTIFEGGKVGYCTLLTRLVENAVGGAFGGCCNRIWGVPKVGCDCCAKKIKCVSV